MPGCPTATTFAGKLPTTTPHAHDCVCSHRHARTDDDAATEARALSMMTIGSAASHLSRRKARIDGMGGGQQLNIRTDLHIVADRHSRHIQRHQAPVREAACANRGLVAVVAVERWADLALTECGQQLGQISRCLVVSAGSTC